MTAATKPTPEEILGEYEGTPIKRTSIIVNKLGDGLSDAVGIEPLVVPQDGFGYLAVKVRPTKHRYEFERNDVGEITGVELVQIFDAVGAMFVDERTVGTPLQVTIDRVAEAKELRRSGQRAFSVVTTDEPPETPRAKSGKDAAAGKD